MKALSLWQPWASAMALGLKRVETRHWSASYRGEIAIHAAKRWTLNEREMAAAMGLPSDLPLGAVVAVGTLSRIVLTEDIAHTLSIQELVWGNYAQGRFGWLFENIRALAEPVPVKGMQGLFNLDAATAEAVRLQTNEVRP